jgi:hypothetical protein
MKGLVASAIEAVPSCPGAPLLRDLIANEARRILPEELLRLVA